MIYKFELGHNAMEAIKKISWAKDEGAVSLKSNVIPELDFEVAHFNITVNNAIESSPQPSYVIAIFVKLTTIVEGNLKALFSIVTTPRYRGGHYSIPWIALVYSRSLPYTAEC